MAIVHFSNLKNVEINQEDKIHGKNVAVLSFKISMIIGLDKNASAKICTAGMLHDIGKTRLDPNIINKKDKFTESDKEYVKAHVYYSAIAALEKGYSAEILRYIYYHHENFDGSGYPSGLSGDEIPLGARIIRVCDFFDALVSKLIKLFSLCWNIKVNLI